MSAYIGLGSNLGEPLKQLQTAFAALDKLTNTRVSKRSSFYASKPMGPADQPDYINAVAEIETALAPQDLLLAMQAIEQLQGRDRSGERWGPRTLDLDILLYAEEVIATDSLQVPHPGLAGRDFVLIPLAEIAPDVVIPGQSALRQLLEDCPDHGLERLPG
ncbi:2-amino-4-hydroxy-6-hydroxymethyldihydropteridine diphosphokinase [Sulfuriflexus mobilis]|uniref:2-amino-4-hydroxy-6- hydroxymethyldihydropteridine diphosphokinase n=1 Tax=Sulfuriflexus mobilis TaxID=1811807 RepID=UPI0030B856AD